MACSKETLWRGHLLHRPLELWLEKELSRGDTSLLRASL